MKQIKNGARFKVLISALIFSVLFLLHSLKPEFLAHVWMVTTSGNVHEIVEYIKSFGMWAIIISFFLDVLVNVSGFLPSVFISAANGILFGIVPGIFISWLAECLGVILSFLLMRSVLREAAAKLIAASSYLQKLDEFSGDNGFKMMLLARSLPYFPSGIITAAGALSKISFHDYALATLIGKFPSIALEVIVGHDIVDYQKNLVRLLIVVVSAAAIYFGIWLTKRKGNGV